MPGRKPIPFETKRRRGTDRPDRHPQNMAEPCGRPSLPSGLSPAAKAEWRRIVPILDSCGLLASSDRATIVAYCSGWSDYMDATKRLDAEGPVIRPKSGIPRLNPVVSAKKNAFAEMMRAAVELGLTPSSRTKIEARPVDEKSDAEKAHFG